MNVVITMAGHSRRFKQAGYTKPKFLIEIDGKTMIEHVLDMFSPNDTFYFIINEKQAGENENLENWLYNLSGKTKIVIIPEHEFGPAYSCLQIENIENDEPVIITYCDFFVEWNYESFLREVHGYDAAIPAFKGFHPASFGHTKYAYLNVNDSMELLELREKESFTDNRSEEYASVGIYYFGAWSVFKKYAEKLMNTGFGNLNEAYVSLLSNYIVEDNGKIKVTQVNKFICWGTPEDLEQYQYWSEFFLREKKQIDNTSSAKYVENLTNIIPGAGRGSRFQFERYNVSKPLIHVGKKPMFLLAANSLPQADKWIFLFRAEVVEKNQKLHHLIESNFSNQKLISVKGDTSGQAATCLLAKSDINEHSPLLIASVDYITVFDQDKLNKLFSDETIDGIVFTYRPGSMLMKSPSAFAWCVTGGSDSVIEKIVEKSTISDNPQTDPLLIGTFWFRVAQDFIDAAENAIKNNITVNGEHYIGNSLNYLIKKGKKLVIFDVKRWVSLGDPFELETYYYWDDFFQKRYLLN